MAYFKAVLDTYNYIFQTPDNRDSHIKGMANGNFPISGG